LGALADEIFGERDPADHFFEGHAHKIEAGTDGGYTLSLPLPFAEKEEMELYRDKDELTIRVGNRRRNFVLPRALWDLEATEARFSGGTLEIGFVRPQLDQ
jgi:arsenite-transporting ATPase